MSEPIIVEEQLVLTTIDNPFNPKTQYEEWKQWDYENGYNTEEYIARLIVLDDSYDADDEVNLFDLTNKVINEILENDSQEVYRLV